MATNYEGGHSVQELGKTNKEIDDTILDDLLLQKKIQLEQGGENIDAVLIKKLNPILGQAIHAFNRRTFLFFERRQIVVLREEMRQELLVYLLSPSFIRTYQPGVGIRTFLFQVCYRRLHNVFVKPQKQLKRTPLDRAVSLEEISHADENGTVFLDPEIADEQLPACPLQGMEELQDREIIKELLLSLPDPMNALLVALYYGLGRELLQSVFEHFVEAVTNFDSKDWVAPAGLHSNRDFRKRMREFGERLKTPIFKELAAQANTEEGVNLVVLGEFFGMTKQGVDLRIKKALEQLRRKKTLLETLNSTGL